MRIITNQVLIKTVKSMEPILGQIQAFGFNFAPRGWALCHGQLLSVSQNSALFSLLGTAFGGDGRTTFGLPDLRGRSIIGMGHGTGLGTFNLGNQGGAETHTLTIPQMPEHQHSPQVAVNNTPGEEASPETAYIASHANGFAGDATPPAVLYGVTSQEVGGGQAFGIRSPYLCINMCISLLGAYPSRN